MTKAITKKASNESVLDTYSNEEKEILRSQICKDANDSEIKLFLMICKNAGLDPMAKQIYCIKRKERMTVQTSIDGFRSMAARTNELAGIDDPIYDSEEGPHPKKSTVTVWRLVGGERRPFTETARWEEYKQEFYSQKSGKTELGEMWKKMPYLMLGKCAESLALRKAFPQQLSGIYTHEEMEQSKYDDVIETKVVDQPSVEPPRPPQATQPIVAGSNPQYPKASQEQIQKIEDMIKKGGWEWETVNTWVKQQTGQSIPLLGPVQAGVVIAALEDRLNRTNAANVS